MYVRNEVDGQMIAGSILELLLERARSGAIPVTFGELMERLGEKLDLRTGQFPYAFLCRYLDRVTSHCVDAGVPPLTVLAVSGVTGKPAARFREHFPDVEAVRGPGAPPRLGGRPAAPVGCEGGPTVRFQAMNALPLEMQRDQPGFSRSGCRLSWTADRRYGAQLPAGDHSPGRDRAADAAPAPGERCGAHRRHQRGRQFTSREAPPAAAS